MLAEPAQFCCSGTRQELEVHPVEPSFTAVPWEIALRAGEAGTREGWGQ